MSVLRDVRGHQNCVTSNAEKHRLRAECKRLELAVEARHAECLKARHDDLLHRSHSYARDGMQAAMSTFDKLRKKGPHVSNERQVDLRPDDHLKGFTLFFDSMERTILGRVE